MSRIQRVVVGLAVVVALALTAAPALAGGGIAPPPPGLVLIPSNVTAEIVIDPHGPFSFPMTSTSQHGTIVLERKHHGEASILFQVQLFGSLGGLFLGCDLSLTNARFVNANETATTVAQYAPMSGYMNQDVLDMLFGHLGLTLSAALQPAITAVTHQHCLPAPLGDTTGIVNPGFLAIEANVGFWAPPGTVIPKK
jgi:hypothetical protein